MSVLTALLSTKGSKQGSSSKQGNITEWNPQCGTATNNSDEYVDFIKRSIDSGRLSIEGNPTITPPSAFSMVKAHVGGGGFDELATGLDVFDVAVRPKVFAWIPDKILPTLVIKCPLCRGPVSCRKWAEDKIYHGLIEQNVYITVQYRCLRCKSSLNSTPGRLLETAPARKVREVKFQADTPDVLATFPAFLQSLWQFYNSGKIICEKNVVEFIRAMATRTSWAAIADAINELKEAEWTRHAELAFTAFHEIARSPCSKQPPTFPESYKLSAAWVRNVYVADSSQRKMETR